MATSSTPEDWVPPQWHSDYGNSELEIKRLRSLALSIRETIPGVRFFLEMPEPGVIEVTVHLMNGVTAKLLTVPASKECSKSRYAIFIYPDSRDEIEQYFQNIDETVSFLRNFE